MNKGNSDVGRFTGGALVTKAFLAILVVFFGALSFVNSAQASTPQSGSVSVTVGSTVAWDGNALGIPPAANGEPTCQDTPLPPVPPPDPGNPNRFSPGLNCDAFVLTIPAGDYTGKRVQVSLTWQTVATDYDLVIRKENNGIAGLQGDGVGAAAPLDSVIGTSGNGTNTFEEFIIDPNATGTGVYYIRAIYYAVAPQVDQYRGRATVIQPTSAVPNASACVLPAFKPTFDNYQAPSTLENYDNAGEPSIGVNWNSGNVLVQARLYTFRASFLDSTSPADPTQIDWYQRKAPGTVTGLDPILFTDSVTGRTIGGELIAVAGSTSAALSDDDLSTITQAVVSGGPQQGFDHQTIGGGPPNRNLSDPVVAVRQPTTDYPHLFYYASQQIAYGTVATSFDGGRTFSATTAYTLAECGGLHGHIKVAPDGTVYLPNKNCQGAAAVVVSENNGATWTVRRIPGSSVGDDDPSVGIGTGGRIYVSYTTADLHPHIVVSDDRGVSWHDDYDLGTVLRDSNGNPIPFRAAVFPSVVAGDNNRAAVFFLATSSTDTNDPTGIDGAPATGADTNPSDNFKGTWYPYMAVTCDGGKSWSVIRADNDPLRPGQKNPVQQGVICKSGTTCPGGPPDTRNLLDFNDVTVDSRGRILAAYADGCVTSGCVALPDNQAAKEGNDGAAVLTIIRQRGGMRLFAEYDSAGGAAPRQSPFVNVEENPKGNDLKWSTPDNNGSPITSYRVYRGVRGKGEKRIAQVKAKVFSFRDRAPKRKVASNVYYRVTAVNKFGESPRNVKFFPSKNGE